jgi:hypothetical protein
MQQGFIQIKLILNIEISYFRFSLLSRSFGASHLFELFSSLFRILSHINQSLSNLFTLLKQIISDKKVSP